MQLHTLTVCNFCNHQSGTFEFAPGMNAIIGPNGSGKSTLFAAISFALVGHIPVAGTKQQNIFQLAGAADACFVRLTFSHFGVRYVVQRNIRPARPTATLTINDNEEIIGDTEVTARILNVLQLPADVLTSVVFAFQRDILGFLDTTPGKRAELFQKLFGTETAATIHKHLTDHVNGLRIPELGVTLDELRNRIRQAETALYEAQQQLATIPPIPVTQQQRDGCQQVQNECRRIAELREVIANKTAQKQGCEAARHQTSVAEQQVRASLAALQQHADSSQPAVQAAQSYSARASLVSQQQRAYRNAKDYADKCQQVLAMLQQTAPQPPQYFCADFESKSQEGLRLHAEIQQLRQFVSSFSHGQCECPTCRTPVDALKDRLDSATRQITQLDQQLRETNTIVQGSRNYLEQKRLFDSKLKATQEQTTAALEALQQTPQPGELQSVENWEEILRQAQQRQVEISRLTGLLNGYVASIATYDGQLQMMIEAIVEAAAALAKLPPHEAEHYQRATQMITECDQRITARAAQEQAVQLHQNTLQHLHRNVQEAEHVQREAATLRALEQYMHDLRGIFHKDAAPRVVAQGNLRRLEGLMNEILAHFQASYRVTADEGLSFKARLLNGAVQPAERLSPGQQVLLLLVFRISLVILMTGDVAALYLDEPTAWLDETHIQNFEPVLQKLRELIAARGLQVLIITHERSLAPLFDSVIQLK